MFVIRLLMIVITARSVMVSVTYERVVTPSGGRKRPPRRGRGSTMSKQVRVALVLAAISIFASVAAEWAIKHLSEGEPHHH